MPSVRRDRLRRRAAVAREHDDADARRHGATASASGRRLLDRVGDGRRAPAGRPSTATNTTVCPSRRRLPRPARRDRPGSTPERSEELRVAERDRRPSTLPATPCPGHRLGSPPPARSASPRSARRRDDGRRERMLAPPLEARGQAQELGLVVARQGHDGDEPRLALGERARLVDDERVDLLQHLERLGVLDEHARRRAAPGADHDRHRRREPERARAGDDQHRDGVDQRIGEPRLGPERSPRRRSAQHRDAPARPARSRPRRGRPGAGSARGCAGPRPPCGRSARAASRRPTRSARITKAPGAVDGAADDAGSPGIFSTGIGSPVTIDSSTALRPSRTTPSTGTFSPGRTRSRSPTATSVERHVLFRARRRGAPRGLRGEAEQRPDRAARPAPGAELEHLAEQHERRDDRRRLEVDARPRPRGRGTAGGKKPGEERRHDAVDVGRARPERDQREHVEAPVHERGPAALEERPAAPEHDGRREHELDPARGGAARRACWSGWPGSCRPSRGPGAGASGRADPEPARHVASSGFIVLLERDDRAARGPCRRSGRLPGAVRTISGCIGQTHSVRVGGASTVTGSSAMPHFGQAPGPDWRTSGCHRAREVAGAPGPWGRRGVSPPVRASGQVPIRVGAEALEAAGGTEPVGAAAMDVRARGRPGIHGHPAHGVGRHLPRRALRRRPRARGQDGELALHRQLRQAGRAAGGGPAEMLGGGHRVANTRVFPLRSNAST